MCFDEWLGRVDREILAEGELDPADWRSYYDAGLTPVEAVYQDRIDNEV